MTLSACPFLRTGATKDVGRAEPATPLPLRRARGTTTCPGTSQGSELQGRRVGIVDGPPSAGQQTRGLETGGASLRAIAISLGLVGLWLCGCGAKRAATYRILGDSAAPVLVPPGVQKPHGNKTEFAVQPAIRDPDCAAPRRGIELRVRHDTVKVSIRQQDLRASPPGWLSRWADDLSDRGCLPRDGRGLFVRRILEAFPLGVGDAYRIAYGHLPASGFIDLVAGQKLKVVGPVLRDDSDSSEPIVESIDPNDGGGLSLSVRSSANLAGYEESWYSITVGRNGDLRLKHDRTKFFHDGEITVLEQPDVTAVSFIPQDRYIRMNYLARVTERGDHDVLFVSGSKREELETRSAAVSRNPGLCLEADSDEWCQGASNRLAINVFVTVALNGTTTEASPGIPLGQFLRRAFGPRAMISPRGLEVYRPHGNRLAKVDFDTSSGTIMTLPLLGGERILLPEESSE